VPGARLAVRAQLDVDNGASGWTVTFSTAPTADGTFTQLGDLVTGTPATSIFAGTQELRVGNNAGGAEVAAGFVYGASVRSGLVGAGSEVANPDFSAQAPGAGSFSDAAGRTWTLIGNADIVTEGGIFHSFQIGRVLCVLSDTRSFRTPNATADGPAKTMLGASQKAWLTDLLQQSAAEALVWFMPTPWLGTVDDTWGGFTTERAELAQLITDTGWATKTVMVSADVHALALSSPGGNPHGGFPILHVASIDATPSGASGEQYDLGFSPGRNRYGTITVDDFGTHITIELAGWIGDTLWGSYTLGIAVSHPTVPGALLRTLVGSHEVMVDVRVLDTFQTGDDPVGTTIPVLRGSVTLDGTAEVRGTFSLETTGVLQQDGESVWPRRAGDLLAPYGNEVFIRYGVGLGGEVIWTPLGYYRIDVVEQSNSPYGSIRMGGFDRMIGITDGRLTQPREFEPTRSVASVFLELVSEIYPDAVIIFDDESALETIGRTLIAEDSRLEPLQELTTSLGKIMYWDGLGFLQVQNTPDELVPVWEMKSGFKGVLTTAQRRITREGAFNGVVARGEGADTDDPVQALVVDNGGSSPTRWGGRFGRVPRFYASPFIRTEAQAEVVARAMLRRHIGLPYGVDFGTIVNPTLRPYEPTRITYGDGNREIHVVERLTIPLRPGDRMTGTTREKTLVSIGVVIS
jgi:hypothetical protein